jgi:YceI-like domain
VIVLAFLGFALGRQADQLKAEMRFMHNRTQHEHTGIILASGYDQVYCARSPVEVSVAQERAAAQINNPTIWQIDRAHTTIEFAAKHMMVTTVRGRFKSVASRPFSGRQTSA